MKRKKKQAVLESLIVFFMTSCISFACFMTIIYAMDESNVYSKPQLHIEMSEPRLRNAAPISVNIFESDEFLTGPAGAQAPDVLGGVSAVRGG